MEYIYILGKDQTRLVRKKKKKKTIDITKEIHGNRRRNRKQPWKRRWTG